MQIQGRPIFSAGEIEEKAAVLLRLYRPDFFDYAMATPLIAITEWLYKKYRVQFDFKASLGFSENGERIMGATNLKKWIVLVDESLQKDPNLFNFTLAHELGHLSLHRKIIFIREDTGAVEPKNIAKEKTTEQETPTTEMEWLEWQANIYATALLMPKEIVRKVLIIQQRDMGIRQTGKIALDHQPANAKDFTELLSRLSKFFGVSLKAMEDRLRKLHLIEDRADGILSISEILASQKWVVPRDNTPSPF